MTALRVPVGGDAPYDVLLGRSLDPLPTCLGEQVQRVLLVTSPAVAPLAQSVRSLLTSFDVTDAEVPDGEPAKTATVLERLWSTLGGAGFTRTDAVVAVGGGAVTDLAGFAAATWLRGIRVVHVPTTLLGMVDAAVGGKTAIDTAHGKNLVGAFYPPAAVVCDLRSLETLPRAEIASGLAEVVKVGFLADTRILDLLEADPGAAFDPRGQVLAELVERSVRVKADVVSGDLREAGSREQLNYGHTLGHAVERVEGYRRRHGEAVSIGLVFAAELAALAGRLSADVVVRHRDLLFALGLPTSYDRAAWPVLLDAMRIDKKSRGSTLRFVVLDAVGRPGLLEGPSEELLEAAYERLCR